jgi:predicted phosphodiesterase
MKQNIKELVAKAINDGVPLQQLLEDYPEVDHWELRRAYAEARKAETLDQIGRAVDRIAIEAPQISKKGIEALHAGWTRPVQLDLPEFEPIQLGTMPEWREDDVAGIHLVVSDIHAPDQDDQAMDVMYQIGAAIVPNSVIINGDLFDCSSLSRFTPSSEQHVRWVEERNEAIKVIAQMRQQFAGIPFRFVPGNHDVRPLNWISSNALPLQNVFTLEQWLGIDDPKLGIEVVHDGRIVLGNLLIKHGVKVGIHAGTSVKKEIDAHGMSVIMGHVHRRAIVEVTKTAHQLVGVELGCLCNLRPSYLPAEETANWQHGFAVVTEFKDGTFDVELVRINQGKAMFRGYVFKSRV